MVIDVDNERHTILGNVGGAAFISLRKCIGINCNFVDFTMVVGFSFLVEIRTSVSETCGFMRNVGYKGRVPNSKGV